MAFLGLIRWDDSVSWLQSMGRGKNDLKGNSCFIRVTALISTDQMASIQSPECRNAWQNHGVGSLGRAWGREAECWPNPVVGTKPHLMLWERSVALVVLEGRESNQKVLYSMLKM